MALASALTGLLALLSAAPPAAQSFTVGERRPITLLIAVPTGVPGNVSTSELIRIVSSVLDEHTGLAPQVFDAASVADCGGRLACIVPRVAAGVGREPAANVPDYILALSNLTQQGAPDVLSAIFADTRAVTTCLADVSVEEGADTCVVERAVLGSARGKIPGEAEARALVEALFVEQLQPVLAAHGIWQPFGELAVAVRPAGASITVDGTFVGRLPEGTARISISAGEHTLVLEHEGFQPDTRRVIVRSRTAESIEVVLAPVPEGSQLARTALAAGGIGAAAAGTAIALYAWGRADARAAEVCLFPAGAADRCGSGAVFQTGGFDPGATPSLDDRVNPPGVLLAPLGYSLAIAGAAWAVSALLVDPEGEHAWLELAIGVAAGALSYGISAAIDGTSALDR